MSDTPIQSWDQASSQLVSGTKPLGETPSKSETPAVQPTASPKLVRTDTVLNRSTYISANNAT